ncbi:MAG: cation diffusion facilitator family transporter [Prevotellaceae bacterium]|nr:cation diffusion facilitator family transporter [Prevotellaceae bacterium]MDY3295743.1 cation diffusion facilitator family transporter [Bacteroidaceae bacterium]
MTNPEHTRQQRIYQVTLLGSIVNVFLLLIKLAAGLLGHSSAMVADAIHSLSDFLTDIVVILFVRWSGKPADEDHDYGHGKYETIATSLIGMALLIVAIGLGWNSMQTMWQWFTGYTLPLPKTIALWTALISIVLKEWIFRITRRVARLTDSQALEANAWHHRSDALSSIAALAGIGGAILLGGQWAVLDAVAALAVSIYIAVMAIRLIRQSYGELLEESLPAETERHIREIVYGDNHVNDVHNLYTRRIGSSIAIEMHLRLPGSMSLKEAHDHVSAIEDRLIETYGDNTHIMIHIEPEKENDTGR